MAEALGMNCDPFINVLFLEQSSHSVLPSPDALASTTSQLHSIVCLP